MTQHLIPGSLPAHVRSKLREYYLAVQADTVATTLWKKHLTTREQEQLGDSCSAAYASGGTVDMWMKLKGVSLERAVVDLAKLLNLTDAGTHRWLMREIGQYSDDPAEMLEMALAQSDLVVMTSTQELYWKRARVDIDWNRHSALWHYFVTLAESSKKGTTIDYMSFGDVEPGYVAKLKSRLTKMPAFPMGLGDLIVTAGRGTQKLDLDAKRIRILVLQQTEVLVEA